MKRAEFLVAVRKADKEQVTAKGGYNKWLMAQYEHQTGQTEFHTFKQWKAKGFQVRKGESSFALFSRPLHVLKQMQGKAVSEGEVMRFGVCHLFHAGQVDPIPGAVAVEQLPAETELDELSSPAGLAEYAPVPEGKEVQYGL